MILTSQIKKIKVFLVDDHPIVRQGLAQMISHEEDMILIGEAGDALEAMDGIKGAMPDLMIIDISLKGPSGIELTKNVLLMYPSMLILIMSMFDETIHADRALKAGAKGYLMKHEATDHIIPAIRKIFHGNIFLSESQKNLILSKSIHRTPVPRTSFEMLTDREQEVLQLIGQGFTTSKIATELGVSVKTIESHFANIKNKLDLKNSHELILFAVKWSLSEKQ